jgi:CheY-like chemotaxis protein
VTFELNYRNQVSHFSITDTGTGISQENQELIFKPFEQIRNAHTQAIGGTGLGLTISRSLAELMGGEITLSSVLGQGSTFKFRLMLSTIYRVQSEPEYAKTKAIGYGGSPQTILVIDDDNDQRRLMGCLLVPLGFTVLSAQDAKQGFMLLTQHNVDLVLLDVRMPDVDGWEMVQGIRQQKHLMPVIMVSANARDAEFNLQAEGYHNDYVAKPVNFDTLLGKIGHLLELSWQYQNIQPIDVVVLDNNNSAKPLVTLIEYQTLMSLAEIGYLSGFKDKLSAINKEYQLPTDVQSQLSEYLEFCNFPAIILYLDEISHE